MDTRTKILDLDAARGLRLEDRPLVVAAGAFDVLQAAHARFLAGLRREGSLLLVAVWDDATLGRPVFTAAARAQLVAALAAVDYVVVCSEPALSGLLDALRPDRVERAVPDGRNIIGEVLERHR